MVDGATDMLGCIKKCEALQVKLVTELWTDAVQSRSRFLERYMGPGMPWLNGAMC